MAAVNPEDLHRALDELGLTLPVTLDQVARKRQELLHVWTPARYANLTNNPKQYMQSFKKAEEMTSRIESAFRVVNEWLAEQDDENVI